MKKFLPFVIVFALCGFLLMGCSSSNLPLATPSPAATGTPTGPVETVPPAPTQTPQATKVILVAPASAEGQAIQAKLADLSSQAGLALETRDALQKTDLTPEMKVVVFPSAPADLADLLSAAPQTQFIVVSGSDLTAADNLTVLRERPENQAFLAGFISVLLSTDYRAGGLLPTDGPLGASLKEAFVNGGRFFCGMCAPGWPLQVYYPVIGELPAASDGAAWQTAAAGLYDNQKVEVYFLSSDSIRPEVISYLQGKTQNGVNVAVVGTQAPPNELSGQWAASVGFDLAAAVEQVWPDVSAGKGGAAIDLPLLVDHVNNAELSEGRLRLVKDLIDELKTGTVSPMSVPAQ